MQKLAAHCLSIALELCGSVLVAQCTPEDLRNCRRQEVSLTNIGVGSLIV